MKKRIRKILLFLTREKEIFALILSFKLITFFIILLAYHLLPFNKDFYRANFIYPPNETITLKTAYKTWDAQHYLYLIEKGYQDKSISIAFFPLFPLIGSLVNSFLNNSFLAGLLVSNFFSFLGLFLFYLFVKDSFNEKVAFTSFLIFLAFPTAFYLNLIYTESLFIFLVVLFFLLLFKNRFFYAALVSILIPFSRIVGFLVVIPFFVYSLLNYKKSSLKICLPTFNRPIIFRIYYLFFFSLFPFLGIIFYFVFMQIKTGDPMSGLKALRFFARGYNLSDLLFLDWNVFIDSFVNNLFPKTFNIHSYTNSFLDRLFFCLFIPGSILIYKKTNIPLFVYCVVFGLVPFIGGFMSYSRYLLPIFPLFIALAIVLENSRFSSLKYPYLFLSFALQILFLIMHSLNYWVS